MGTYYSAARDPIFYLLHHANSEVWLELDLDDDDDPGNRPRHADFTDPDWLDSSFLFYDEDARLVRVTVRDMLDMGRLRYTYGEVDMPWLKARPLVTPNLNRGTGPHRLKSVSIRFPVWLDAAVTARTGEAAGRATKPAGGRGAGSRGHQGSQRGIRQVRRVHERSGS
jgi:polyphenol oxidase